MDDWQKAGKIAWQALNYGKSLIKINENLLEVVEKIENEIIKNNAFPAFPVNVSINEMAAHFTPNDEKDLIFKENDLVKLDVGVHVNGFIGDNALTIDLGNNKELSKASQLALNEAVKLAKPGTKIYEIGSVIEKTIKEFGFNPIRNLSGHGIEQYEQHSGLTIPNYNNNDNLELEENQIIAIEPFATNGVGLVQDGKPSNIFKVVNVKPIRDNISRDVLRYIIQEYKTLPFAKRWLLKKFDSFKVNFALRNLERESILHNYPQLPEKSKGLVSQHEHTIMVKDNPEILTKE